MFMILIRVGTSISVIFLCLLFVRVVTFHLKFILVGGTWLRLLIVSPPLILIILVATIISLVKIVLGLLRIAVVEIPLELRWLLLLLKLLIIRVIILKLTLVVLLVIVFFSFDLVFLNVVSSFLHISPSIVLVILIGVVFPPPLLLFFLPTFSLVTDLVPDLVSLPLLVIVLRLILV